MLADANLAGISHADILEKYRPRGKVSVGHPRYSLVHEGDACRRTHREGAEQLYRNLKGRGSAVRLGMKVSVVPW